jgi:signal recognition particle subunit SRP54
MFDNLTNRLSSVVQSIKGSGRLTDKNIQDTLRQIRLALLEADVSLPVVKEFISNISEKVVGTKFDKSLTPGQALTKIIQNELIEIFGNNTFYLNLNRSAPIIIMLVGLQGSGKTTTAGKLAKRLIFKEKKKVLLVSVDIHRPAAIEQLKRLSKEVDADFYESDIKQKPNEIIRSSLSYSERAQSDIIIIDSAGRSQLDSEMMNEIVNIKDAAEPHETFFVIDSMAGQDAINPAKVFSEKLDLTGVILSKTDGDARGGAALSVKQVTGKPICYIGTGEKIDDLELFHPKRMASRILGMGDILSLVEDIEFKADKKQSEKLAKKIKKGKKFDLSDLKDQLQQMMNMGGMGELLKKLPMGKNINNSAMESQFQENQLKHQIAIINSMTPSERRFPKTINGSRKRRIAKGSGLEIQDVNKLMKQFIQMERMMKKMSGGKIKRMMKNIPGMNNLPGI